jgi:pSer/pThr/pTyr-binding forkhead associated (FHA) protein
MAVYEFVGGVTDATVCVAPRPRTSAELEVTYGPTRFVIGAQRRRLTIGRQATHDICIDHAAVSRLHAEVVVRGDKFVLADKSTNGTYVYPDTGQTIRLLRDETTLSGQGRIVAGVESEPPIRYRVSA